MRSTQYRLLAQLARALFVNIPLIYALIVHRLMDSAREIVRESLPIKCLEAVALSLYLTSPLTSVQRFAIGFKSKFSGLHYRHIVLGIHWNSLYGALGMSRRDSLMYKPLSYTVRSRSLYYGSYSVCIYSHWGISLLTTLSHTRKVCT